MRRPWWLSPPPPEADPREILRWVRRGEIASGIAGIGFGFALLSEGSWAWLVIAMGVIGLSPWPGAQQILRKAERKPDVLVHDPERRRQRGRRAVLALVPLYVLCGGAIAYLADGWTAAIFVGTFMGVVGALSAWSFWRSGSRRSRT